MQIYLNPLIYLLQNSLWFNAITFILAIAGLLLTIIFYFRSQKLRGPVYALRNFNLIKEKIEKNRWSKNKISK